MISEKDRFYATSGDITPDGPSVWHIIDWDQRRNISVKMSQELDDEEPAIEQLKKHIDEIDSEIFLIHVSPSGRLLSSSKDPKYDQAMSVYYPPIKEVTPVEGRDPIRRSELIEIDRLGPGADLVSHAPTGAKLEFKYYWDRAWMFRIWDEMNLWRRLPRHPHIAVFDNIVVDEGGSKVIGFTTESTHGASLRDQKRPTFKLKWLKQLINVVNDLNLKYGIQHQNISTETIIVDTEKDSIKLTNFNVAVHVGSEDLFGARDDILGVSSTVYEFITRRGDYDQRGFKNIQARNWIQHPEVVVDAPGPQFHALIKEWQDRRASGPQILSYKAAPEHIEWPVMTEPEPISRSYIMQDGSTRSKSIVTYCERRIDALANGREVLNWERPPQSKLAKGERVLATGKRVEQRELSATNGTHEEEKKEAPAMCPMGMMKMQFGGYSMDDMDELLKLCPFSGRKA
ncbi:unnamed protein product [Clonostachys rosea f. rosea IK726]|uniref:Protein kinase domain-containing protein n=2 Tax=Bionectria ochroleuca TaxID=29856 RepID=A0A0B7JUT5_BIOOC|nr:unnamed protein product [Clonostachys rosea f. rosea IK726]